MLPNTRCRAPCEPVARYYSPPSASHTVPQRYTNNRPMPPGAYEGRSCHAWYPATIVPSYSTTVRVKAKYLCRMILATTVLPLWLYTHRGHRGTISCAHANLSHIDLCRPFVLIGQSEVLPQGAGRRVCPGFSCTSRGEITMVGSMGLVNQNFTHRVTNGVHVPRRCHAPVRPQQHCLGRLCRLDDA